MSKLLHINDGYFKLPDFTSKVANCDLQSEGDN